MTSRLHIAAGCAPDVCCSIIHGAVRGRVRARSVDPRRILRHLVCPFVGTRQRRSDVRIYLFSLTCVLATPACALDSSSLAGADQDADDELTLRRRIWLHRNPVLIIQSSRINALIFGFF